MANVADIHKGMTVGSCRVAPAIRDYHRSQQQAVGVSQTGFPTLIQVLDSRACLAEFKRSCNSVTILSTRTLNPQLIASENDPKRQGRKVRVVLQWRNESSLTMGREENKLENVDIMSRLLEVASDRMDMTCENSVVEGKEPERAQKILVNRSEVQGMIKVTVSQFTDNLYS